MRISFKRQFTYVKSAQEEKCDLELEHFNANLAKY